MPVAALSPAPPAYVALTGVEVWLDDGKQAGLAKGLAVVLKGNRILAVGPEVETLKAHPAARRIALRGGTLLPAPIEGHVHVEGMGQLKARVELAGAPSLEEVRTRVKTWAAAHGMGWIQGRGWDQNLWKVKAFPTSADLDAVTGVRPAALRRVDGHALWVNGAALKLAGITDATPDPAGGRIIRDVQGHATGVFIDGAMELVSKVIPAPSAEERQETLRLGLLALRDLGFSAAADMGCDAEALAAYRRLQTAGTLPIRVFTYINPDEELVAKELANPKSTALSFLTVQGVKLYLDGALGSRGARMLAPYADEPTTQGLWVQEPVGVGRMIARTLQAGYQPAVHCIGDGANRRLLDLVAPLQKGPLPVRDEHSQIVTPEDAARFGQLNVVASVQPIHLSDDHAWTPTRLGPERLKEAFPWRTFLKGGAQLCFGSDGPVSDPNPFLGMAAAETRQDPQGRPTGGFGPEHKLTRTEALRAYTLGNAQVLGSPDLGTIRPGAAADLLWVQAPLLQLTPAQLRALKPGRLWVDGVEVKLGQGSHENP
jgi:predicted amidohydrolase YtcJ